MTGRNFYEILGVSLTATAQEIRAAHRALSRKYHPDTASDGTGNTRAFAQVQEAYEALSNADVRRRYDNKQATTRDASSFSSSSPKGTRRLRKSPCAVCEKPVFASQLTLYLGRHMCMMCLAKRKTRERNRVRISTTSEMIWQFKRFRIWAQSHFAVLAVAMLAIGFVGMRLSSAFSHPHQDDAPVQQAPASGTASTGQSKAPPAPTESADVRGMREPDR